MMAGRAARFSVFAVGVSSTVCIVCLSWLFAAPCRAQAEQDSLKALKSAALKVYIDCDECDTDYIRTEITFVNYVRDRKEAGVHVLITTQRTGSGGTEYTLTFIGQQNYAGMGDTLTYASNRTNTQDDIRRGIVQTLKMGLIRYVARTPLTDQIAISFKQKVEPTAVVDRWNYWVFSINTNTFLNGEQTSNFLNFFSSLSANRTTLNWKVRSSVSMSYSESNFTAITPPVKSISRFYEGRELIVKSLNGQWSTGIFVSGTSSTFNNTKFNFSTAPAIEYDLLPYSESTRRQVRVLYRIGYSRVRYQEETIFSKTSETLSNEALSITLDVKQPWGSVEATLEGSNYLQDFSKHRINLFSELSLRLFKGFSLNGAGSVSRIKDQLSLPKGQLTPEEILLRRSQQGTSYRYFTSFGLSYTFGSIYSNVVNPRFGNQRF